MALKLHHLIASRSQRLVWLLKELGAPHEIVHHERHPKTHLAPPALLDIHPMGKSPLLEDGEIIIAETGAIAQYLLAKYDSEHRLHPAPSSPDFPRYLEWVHSAEGAPFLPNLLGVYLRMSNLTDSVLAQMMRAEQKKAGDHIEAHLAHHAYFAGKAFTAADCLMGFNLQGAEAAGDLESRPASKAWLNKVRERPAYKQMLAVGI